MDDVLGIIEPAVDAAVIDEPDASSLISNTEAHWPKNILTDAGDDDISEPANDAAVIHEPDSPALILHIEAHGSPKMLPGRLETASHHVRNGY